MDVGVIILVTLKVHSKILIQLNLTHTASLLVQACVRTVYVIRYTLYNIQYTLLACLFIKSMRVSVTPLPCLVATSFLVASRSVSKQSITQSGVKKLEY